MRNYVINYNDCKTTIVTAIDAVHARETLKKVMPDITINSTIPVPKNAKYSKKQKRKDI